MDIVRIMGRIYEDVFCNTFSKSCFVFLCGGAGKDNIRNAIRPLLERKQFQILYPEDLFMEMLNRDKKSDLLEYENLLANNSDIICIICESFGSAVELGAFVQNESINNKMVVAVNQKYSRDKSFVMLGPIKHLKKVNESSFIAFKPEDLKSLGDDMTKVFRKLHKSERSNKAQSFDTISAYIGFIPIIVYFFQTISRRLLHKNLRLFLKERNCSSLCYNDLFNASIKYLIKSGILVTDFNIDEKDETFSLSSKGYTETLGLIERSSASNRTILHDRIRCVILKEQLDN